MLGGLNQIQFQKNHFAQFWLVDWILYLKIHTTVQEWVFIVENLSKYGSYQQCREAFLVKFGKEAPVKIVIQKFINKLL